MEIWRDIPGYEGIYEASSEGRIRSKLGKTTSRALMLNITELKSKNGESFIIER